MARKLREPLTALKIKVNNYAVLKTIVRNDYGGRLVDILDLEV